MTAKHKLNSAFVCGAFVFAGMLGGITGSWIVFFIALGILLATSFHDGSLRL
jgi:hypothetical protein